jgi:hypothetical protein
MILLRQPVQGQDSLFKNRILLPVFSILARSGGGRAAIMSVVAAEGKTVRG